MRNHEWGLGSCLIVVTIFLVATIDPCLGARNTTVACFEHERLALVKFKHSVIEDYGMLSTWVDDDCCRWERVTCDSVSGNVESLHLRSANFHKYGWLVSNEISTSLGELKHLKHLDISGNNFQKSQIPKFIGSLKELTYLNLSYTNLAGIIPPHIGNLSNLKILDLSSYIYPQLLMANDMAWISGLSSLEHLGLGFMNLSTTKNLDIMLYMIPSLKELGLSSCGIFIDDLVSVRNLSTTLSNIKYLDVSGNVFKGQIPHFFQNMTSLQFLDLSHCPFNLTSNFVNLLNMIPSVSELHLSDCNVNQSLLPHIHHNFTTLSNIQHLDLTSNKLTGSISESLGKLELLRVLYLQDNELTGSIPESIGKLELLQVLNLQGNELTGSIPESIGKLELLQVLYLQDNELTGLIPTFSGKLTELDLSNNHLSGSIPVSIGQLTKLRSLDVSKNSLEGVVYESHFANLSMLKDLNAAFNTKLTFDVSHEWMPPFQLISIDLKSCKIANGFPRWLRTQRELKMLVLSNTTISGPLPTWWRKMPAIPCLDLSHNNLSGPLTNLPSGGGTYIDDYSINQVLFLQNNNFNESIPKSLCKRTDLYYLDLSKNRLTGKIPNCFKNLQKLGFMILSSNELCGVIPSFIGQISGIYSLNLNDNNFSGELPVEVWNLSGLIVLDLGDNAFCGKIPEWIGEKVKSLWVFRLHNNNFTGRIPPSLCTNLGLQILDVAHNKLTGTIPHCLGELQRMINEIIAVSSIDMEEELIQVMKGISLEYTNTWSLVTNMNLSSNNLIEEIPGELTALSALLGLNLSNNHLSGGIPLNIGNMTALESLDLSGNELSGLIPPSMADLNFLSHLNLSNNNLSGRIPTGNQLQTFIDSSIYAGNKDLCGAPLPKNCSNHEEPTTTPENKHEAADESEVWFYLDITCGFVTGFWGFIILLVFKKQWRHKFFMFDEEIVDKIHVAVMVRVNKMKRGREAI